MTIPAAINYARRLSTYLSLQPPIDVESLVKRYAKLESGRFPVDVDGICIDLKVPGRKPKVIINSERPKNRRRFTLAHELGHLIIPWHVGSIVDVTDIDHPDDDDYWDMESQANRFASELLMPAAWVQSQIDAEPNPLRALRSISATAIVSAQAATIRLLDILPPGHIVAALQDGVVEFSGRSGRTLANNPPRDSAIDVGELFPWAKRWEADIGDRQYVWWEFPQEIDPPVLEMEREWRNVLDGMLLDLSPVDPQNFKKSLNGIIAYANGSIRGERTHGAILNACLQRLHSRAMYDPFVARLLKHELFEAFLDAKIRGMLKAQLER